MVINVHLETFHKIKSPALFCALMTACANSFPNIVLLFSSAMPYTIRKANDCFQNFVFLTSFSLIVLLYNLSNTTKSNESNITSLDKKLLICCN